MMDSSKGILTFAQNNKKTDYVRLAYLQALSVKLTQRVKNYAIIVSPGTVIPAKYREVIDTVIELEHDEARHQEWKLANEWQALSLSPFEQTLKVDVDMLFFQDLSHWWTLYDQHDLVCAAQAFDYRGERVSSDYYRKTFTSNALPNLYSGLCYFRKSSEAWEFFTVVRELYWYWPELSVELLDHTRPKEASTDVVFALAAKLLDLAPVHQSIGFTHMKRYVQNVKHELLSERWTESLSWRFSPTMQLYVENIAQRRPFHYHHKAFATEALIARYEQALGV